jgi:hypothetical protein
MTFARSLHDHIDFIARFRYSTLLQGIHESLFCGLEHTDENRMFAGRGMPTTNLRMRFQKGLDAIGFSSVLRSIIMGDVRGCAGSRDVAESSWEPRASAYSYPRNIGTGWLNCCLFSVALYLLLILLAVQVP